MNYSKEVSPEDHMVTATMEIYFRVTDAAIECILRGLRAAGINPEDVTRAMDYGCGYGRVYRAFPVMFPKAELAAVDLMEKAVTFCASTFGGTPIHSKEDFTTYLGDEPFDVVWLGSVFTHLPASSWHKLLAQLAAHTRKGGAVIFTAHGKTAIQHIENVVLKRNPYLIDKAFFDQMKATLPEKGFDFAANVGGNHAHQVKMGMSVTQGTYGFSFSTREWITELFNQHPDWIMVDYAAPGWGGNHDAVTIVRR